jgi:carbon monoxide dehydrogenase subunit G
VRIDSDFTVKAPIEAVWAYLLDVEKVAPCMPGAQLTEVVDERTWKGKTNIKVGPVALSFAGTVVLEERDDEAHRVRLKAQGMEQRGKGAASAVVESHLEEVDGGTKVTMGTDLTISGAVAQYGRGMMLDISQRMTREFAQCLEANINASGGQEPAAQEAGSAEASSTGEATPPSGGEAGVRSNAPQMVTAKPVKGFRLGLWAFWRAVVRFFRRLVGRGGEGPTPAGGGSA